MAGMHNGTLGELAGKSRAYNWGDIDHSDTVALLFSHSFEVFFSQGYRYPVGVLQTEHPIAESKECPPVPEP